MGMNRTIESVKRRISLMIGRTILKTLSDSGGTQTVQLSALKGETLSDVERLQDYGFTSYPNVDTSEALVLFPNGNRSAGVVVVINNREDRPTGELTEGDSMQYDDTGGRVKLSGGLAAIGNADSGVELLDLFDQLLTKLQGSVDAPGVASTGTLSVIIADLALIQADLAQIKGSL